MPKLNSIYNRECIKRSRRLRKKLKLQEFQVMYQSLVFIDVPEQKFDDLVNNIEDYITKIFYQYKKLDTDKVLNLRDVTLVGTFDSETLCANISFSLHRNILNGWTYKDIIKGIEDYTEFEVSYMGELDDAHYPKEDDEDDFVEV